AADQPRGNYRRCGVRRCAPHAPIKASTVRRAHIRHPRSRPIVIASSATNGTRKHTPGPTMRLMIPRVSLTHAADVDCSSVLVIGASTIGESGAEVVAFALGSSELAMQRCDLGEK